MPYVFTVRNKATGSVQIGQDYANLALRSKVTITSVAGTGNWTHKAVLTVTSADPPVVAVRSDVLTYLFGVERSGNVWTFTYYTHSVGAVITCYIFGEPDVSGLAPGYSLRIRNPVSGKVVFDHRLKYARHVGEIEGADSNVASAAVPAGKTYAAIQCRHAGSYSMDIYTGDGGHSGGLNERHDARYGLGLRFVGNEARSGGITLFWRVMPTNISPGQFSWEWPAYKWLLVDVTGY